jgi:hypothetical protein
MYVDEAFTPEFISSLDALYPRLTVVTSEKSDTCAVRSFHCDVDGSISRVLAPVRAPRTLKVWRYHLSNA